MSALDQMLDEVTNTLHRFTSNLEKQIEICSHRVRTLTKTVNDLEARVLTLSRCVQDLERSSPDPPNDTLKEAMKLMTDFVEEEQSPAEQAYRKMMKQQGQEPAESVDELKKQFDDGCDILRDQWYSHLKSKASPDETTPAPVMEECE